MITIGGLFAIVVPVIFAVCVGTAVLTRHLMLGRRQRTRRPTAPLRPPAGSAGLGDQVAHDVAHRLARSRRDYSLGAGHMDEAHEFWTGEHALNWPLVGRNSGTGEGRDDKALRIVMGNSHALWAIWTRLEQLGTSIHHPALPRRVENVLVVLDDMIHEQRAASPEAMGGLARMLRGEDDSS